VQHVEVDTTHFSASSPESCSIESCEADGLPLLEILPRTLLQPNTRHHFEHELLGAGPISHVRFNIFPDGGVSRLRIRGMVSAPNLSAKDLLSCCASRRWAMGMAALQPFADAGHVLRAADGITLELEREDWLEAFGAHPRIGQATADRRAREEQSGTMGMAATVADRLDAVNSAYEERFGYIYIVCAPGKSAEQMLAFAESRLENDPDTELRIAAEEQRRITRLRLQRAILGQ
ncbi:MAG: 2-oxo-4-hydroxy-4-carboxy-5-ureidoimidazoline decarboxylase, partial [Bryobacteraceae bacterium]